MVWRMCFAHQNDWLNQNPYILPSAHGLVFCYGGWRRFKQHCKTKRLRYSRDISAWDINAPGWVLKTVRDLRIRWGGPVSWARTVTNLYADAFENAKLIFSNGLVVEQKFTGFMKSGLYNTITDNSLAMVSMHILAAYRARMLVGALWATGDDVLQENLSADYLVELEGLGCVVKEYEENLTFMGTNFDDKPKPVYFLKHIVNFWTQKDFRPETLDSYARLYCYQNKEFSFWKEVAQSLEISLKSQAYYQFWYSSPFAKVWNAWLGSG